MDMYHILQQGQSLAVHCNGNEILGDIRPCLMQENGKKVQLQLMEFVQQDKQTKALYTDGQNITCILTFNYESDRLCCSFSGKVEYETSYPADGFRDIFIQIGRIPKVKNYLGLYRHNLWWTRPKHTASLTEIPDQTQSLIWKTENIYYHLFPLCENGMVSCLRGFDQGLQVKVQSNTTGILKFRTKAFVLTENQDPFALGKQTAKAADAFLPGKRRTSAERRYPEPFEYLGWCSWNAFYDKVSEDGVLQKAEEFRQKGVPVRWFLIDHGWSDEKNGQLYSFRENREKFPDGLKGTKEKLQETGIQWLGVWQGMGGHWGTVADNSELARDMKENLFRTNGGELIPYPDRKKAFAFWDQWHDYLADQGVDFVKVDIQSSLATFVRGLMLPDEAAREAHSGLEASIGIHFDGACINSMAMGTENFLNRPVSGISRNSNDFFPHKENSFTVHAYDNAYNSLYHSAFVHGDWDMWWTEHEDARNNAYLRALSGGPIYISDCVGATDPEELKPLILSDGRILRCQHAGCVTEDEILTNPADSGSALKVWNQYGKTGYVGVFALSGLAAEQKADLTPVDIPGFEEKGRYLLRCSGEDSANFIPGGTRLSVQMAAGESRLYSFTETDHDVAFLGLLDKYLSSAGIEKTIPGQNSMLYILKESGRIGYGCCRSHEVYVNGTLASPEKAKDLWILDLPETGAPVSVEIRFLAE